MVDKILDGIVKTIQIILGIIILIMAGANVIQVITRYFVSVQVMWGEDVSMLGLYWIFGLGTPMCWVLRKHLNMNAFEMKMSPKVRLALWILQNIVGIACGVGIIYLGAKCIEINAGFIMSTIGFDEAFRYYPLVACGILMIVVCVLLLIKSFGQWKTIGKEVKAV